MIQPKTPRQTELVVHIAANRYPKNCESLLERERIKVGNGRRYTRGVPSAMQQYFHHASRVPVGELIIKSNEGRGRVSLSGERSLWG